MINRFFTLTLAAVSLALAAESNTAKTLSQIDGLGGATIVQTKIVDNSPKWYESNKNAHKMTATIFSMMIICEKPKSLQEKMTIKNSKPMSMHVDILTASFKEALNIALEYNKEYIVIGNRTYYESPTIVTEISFNDFFTSILAARRTPEDNSFFSDYGINIPASSYRPHPACEPIGQKYFDDLLPKQPKSGLSASQVAFLGLGLFGATIGNTDVTFAAAQGQHDSNQYYMPANPTEQDKKNKFMHDMKLQLKSSEVAQSNVSNPASYPATYATIEVFFKDEADIKESIGYSSSNGRRVLFAFKTEDVRNVLKKYETLKTSVYEQKVYTGYE